MNPRQFRNLNTALAWTTRLTEFAKDPTLATDYKAAVLALIAFRARALMREISPGPDDQEDDGGIYPIYPPG